MNYDNELNNDFNDADMPKELHVAEEMTAEETFECTDNIRKVIHKKMTTKNKKAEEHYVKNFNKTHEVPVQDFFQVGNTVWKFNAKDSQRKEKNKPNWHGPYKVTGLTDTGGCYLKDKFRHKLTRDVPHIQLTRQT